MDFAKPHPAGGGLGEDEVNGESRPRVLCVDDNRDVADSEAELLRLVGFQPRACYDGASALRAAREWAPDVCLIDLHMPDMDGDELAERLRAEAGGRPVLMVAVTAISNDESHARTVAAGFALHLVKPVDPHDLLRVVDELWRLIDASATSRVTGERGG